MNRFFYVILASITVICVCFTGCSSGTAHMQRSPAEDFGDNIDPFDYGDEFLISTADDIDTETGGPRSETNTMQRETISSPGNNMPRTPRETNMPGTDKPEVVRTGYRVQIGTFQERANADKLAELARRKTELPVYIEYHPPLYRVRVGDFTNRSEAEECVKIMKEKRFSDANLVFSSINTQ